MTCGPKSSLPTAKARTGTPAAGARSAATRSTTGRASVPVSSRTPDTPGPGRSGASSPPDSSSPVSPRRRALREPPARQASVSAAASARERGADADAVLVLLRGVARRRLLAGQQVELVGGVHEGVAPALAEVALPALDGGEHGARVLRGDAPQVALGGQRHRHHAEVGGALKRAGARDRLGQHVAVVPARAQHHLQVDLEAGCREPLERRS